MISGDVCPPRFALSRHPHRAFLSSTSGSRIDVDERDPEVFQVFHARSMAETRCLHVVVIMVDTFVVIERIEHHGGLQGAQVMIDFDSRLPRGPI